MEKENIAVGLDIGTTKIVAMIGKKNEYGKLEILGVGKSKSLGVARGVVTLRKPFSLFNKQFLKPKIIQDIKLTMWW
jgi:ribosomal protein L7Ae-like RNA K-turn-binding protein